jgi:hypothetical protein
MSNRKISEHINGNKKAIVRYNNELAEYVVRFYIKSIADNLYHWQTESDYYTDDKLDAIQTAKTCINDVNNSFI